MLVNDNNIIKKSKLNNEKILKILLILVYLLPIFTKTNIYYDFSISIFILIIIIFFFFNEKFFLILPILIFYSSNLIVIGEIKVFDVFLILFIVKAIFNKRIIFNKRLLIPTTIFLIYCIGVIAYQDLKLTLTLTLTFIFVALYVSRVLKDKYSFSRFIKYFIFAAISTSVYGMLKLYFTNDSLVVVDGTLKTIARNIGTFNDPNYFGFFINIGILSLLALRNYYSRVMFFTCLSILYISLISTISFTAILCNALGLMIFILFDTKNKMKNIFSLILGIFFIITLWNFAPKYDIPFINDIIYRIESKGIGSDSINIDEVTTNRSYIWEKHLDFFSNQPSSKILFGGNYLTDYGFDSNFDTVSHQSFIDMLINFGLIGTLILLLSFMKRTFEIVKEYFGTNNELFLVLILIKYVWIFYAFGLSMFPAWTFILFFLL